jgi:hypothetical protein
MSAEVTNIVVYLLLTIGGSLWLHRIFSNLSIKQPSRAVHHDEGYHHSCDHCQRITIRLPSDLVSGRIDFLLRLDHTIADIAQAAADDCPLFQEAHAACNFPLATRLKLQYQVFLSISDIEAPLHAFTGCNTFKERVRYFLQGLSNRPLHLRFGRLSSEAGGTLYARLLYSAWHSFELDLSAELGKFEGIAWDPELMLTKMTLLLN